MSRPLPAWVVSLALALPLVAITAWVIRGATGGRAPRAAPEGPPAGWPGLSRPLADLPAERLEERVNGAADGLRADGCRRLLAWRFERPPADAEALVFRAPEDARRVFEREAGPARTAGPGEEAQVAPQAVYFRRDAVLVRAFLDPGAAAAPGELEARAREIDRALLEGGPW